MLLALFMADVHTNKRCKVRPKIYRSYLSTRLYFDFQWQLGTNFP